MKIQKQNMLQGPLFWNIVQYTIPIILTSVLQLLFNAADMIIVGRFCGSLSLGAVGATSSLNSLFVNFFIGFSVGSGVAVARAIGGGDEQQVHRTVHTAIPVALASGAVLTVGGILFCEPMLRLMGTPENVLPLSAVYMRIHFAGIVFSLLYNFGASILRAAGDSQSPLIYLTIAGVLNVTLNVVFVTVWDMNVAGVSLATTISQAVSCVLVLRALARRTDSSKLVLKKIRWYWKELREIIRIGLPAGIQSALFAISNVLIQSSVNSFGEAFITGNSAGGNIDGFVYAILNSYAQTAVNFVGQNAGAKRFDRVKRIAWICIISVAVLGVALGQVVYAFGPQLLSIYITDSQQAIDYGMIRLAYVCVPYFLCVLMGVATSLLRGMGSSVLPLVISVIGACGLRIVWIMTVFQMPAFHTPQGLYLSYGVSWTATFLVQLLFFCVIFRKQKRRHMLETL